MFQLCLTVCKCASYHANIYADDVQNNTDASVACKRALNNALE